MAHLELVQRARDAGPAAPPSVVVRIVIVQTDYMSIHSSSMESLASSMCGSLRMEDLDEGSMRGGAEATSGGATPRRLARDILERGGGDYGTSDGEGSMRGLTDSEVVKGHEVVFATFDAPGTFSRLTQATSDSGMEIKEAHSYVTTDRMLLTSFVVEGYDESTTAEALEGLVVKELESHHWGVGGGPADRQRMTMSGARPVQQQATSSNGSGGRAVSSGSPAEVEGFGRVTVAAVAESGDGTRGGFQAVMSMQQIQAAQRVRATAAAGGLAQGGLRVGLMKQHLDAQAARVGHSGGSAGSQDPSLGQLHPNDDMFARLPQYDAAHAVLWSELKPEKWLATGNQTELWRGLHKDEVVAIKLMNYVPHMDDTRAHDFLHEINILRRLNHPNVLGFMGACTRPGERFAIVTEFMDGGSVHALRTTYTEAGQPFPEAMLVGIALDVVRGMEYLHQNNIIHRDLKAANLLYNINGLVKVADFGVAREVVSTGSMTAETGTYRWMAPEVIAHKPYDAKADVYSFGVLLWELITGEVPYADVSPMQAAIGVVQRGMRPVIPGTCPAYINELLRECWKTNSKARPSMNGISALFERRMAELGGPAACKAAPAVR